MNDLIYREELKNKLLELENEALNLPDYNEEERIRNTGIIDGIEACLDELDNAPSVLHKPEDAPEDKADILIWYYNYNISSDLLLHDKGVYRDGKFEPRDEWCNDFDEKKQPIEIVAWMYFPELPDDFI